MVDFFMDGWCVVVTSYTISMYRTLMWSLVSGPTYRLHYQYVQDLDVVTCIWSYVPVTLSVCTGP